MSKNNSVWKVPNYLKLTLCIMIIALIAGIFIATSPHSANIFYSDKARELTLQFLFVAVLGGGVALFYRAMESRRAETLRNEERMRDRMEAQRSALEKFRQDLIENYHSTKKIRRDLRAVVFSTGEGGGYFCSRDNFERLMSQLEEIQLRTEALAADVEARHDIFNDANTKRKLYEDLKISEDYLRKLLKQYEDCYGERRSLQGDDLIKLKDNLANFVAPSAVTKEFSNFYTGPMSKSRKTIVSLIEENTPKSISSI